MPDMQKPLNTRRTNQAAGFRNSACKSAAEDATDANPAKTRDVSHIRQ